MEKGTPISDTQKGRLEKIVIENNTYDRYYDAKHAKADSGLLAKFKKEIAAVVLLDKEYNDLRDNNSKADDVLRAKHNKDYKKLQEEQSKEFDALRLKQSKETESLNAQAKIETDLLSKTYYDKRDAVSKKRGQMETRLSEAGIERHYNGNWTINTNRFHSEYQNWLRDLRARIITATSAEEAKALVDEFLLK